MKKMLIFFTLFFLFSCRYEDDQSKLPEGKLIFLPNGIIAALEAASGLCVVDLSDIDNCNL